MKDLPISIDFQAQKHGVVTPVQYYISMLTQSKNPDVQIMRVYFHWGDPCSMSNYKDTDEAKISDMFDIPWIQDVKIYGNCQHYVRSILKVLYVVFIAPIFMIIRKEYNEFSLKALDKG